jgi:hypothetical protein
MRLRNARLLICRTGPRPISVLPSCCASQRIDLGLGIGSNNRAISSSPLGAPFSSWDCGP